jgi:hypothetical protein
MPAKMPPDVGEPDLWPPRKTTPVRRLTVNRKPLRTPGSLAQPPISGNWQPVGHSGNRASALCRYGAPREEHYVAFSQHMEHLLRGKESADRQFHL